jgi:phosphoadenosine phosphosulfate reductase
VDLEEKVVHAKNLINDVLKEYPRVAVACSFGKDSMVTVDIAKQVNPQIKVFAIMTPFKPAETFDYLRLMNEKMDLNTTVYIVADSVPELLRNGNSNLDVRLLPLNEFNEKSAQVLSDTREPVSSLDVWITGLRNTEGRTRTDYQEVEHKGGLIKVNPILTFTETDIWKYMSTRGIESHPWYGRGYRSLGCEPCSNPGGELERDGRWQDTSKCGGECGIHTQVLK